MSHWVKARTFATRFEAEMARARLESADIPATIHSHAGSGVFGAGFQGMIPGGVELRVPLDRLSEASEVLADDNDIVQDAES
jgi:hypothetical protein